MFRFLLRLLKKGATKASTLAKSPFKSAIRIIKHPVKSLKDSLNFKKKFKSKVAVNEVLKKKVSTKNKKTGSSSAKKVKKTGSTASTGTKLDSRSEKIADLVAKSNLIESMSDATSEILRGKSSAQVAIDEIVKDINKSDSVLKSASNEQLDNMEKMLDKKLKELNIDPEKFDELTEKQFYDTSVLNSYETYMDNWKEKFFDSDTTEHMSDDEKEEIWNEIEETRTFSWFQNNKLD